jgi:hypothetical protein
MSNTMNNTTTASGASTATTSRSALREAVTAAVRRLGRQPTIGFVFCSPTLSLEDAMAMANELQPGATWLGCTSLPSQARSAAVANHDHETRTSRRADFGSGAVLGLGARPDGRFHLGRC